MVAGGILNANTESTTVSTSSSSSSSSPKAAIVWARHGVLHREGVWRRGRGAKVQFAFVCQEGHFGLGKRLVCFEWEC